MRVLAFVLAGVGALPMDATPGDSLVSAFTTAITSYTPTIAAVFGAAIGLAFLIGLGYFIIGRVRSAL